MAVNQLLMKIPNNTLKKLAALNKDFTSAYVHGYFSTLNCFPVDITSAQMVRHLLSDVSECYEIDFILDVIDYRDKLLQIAILGDMKLPPSTSIPKKDWQQVFESEHKLNQWSNGAKFAKQLIDNLSNPTFSDEVVSIVTQTNSYFCDKVQAKAQVDSLTIEEDFEAFSRLMRQSINRLINMDAGVRFNLIADDYDDDFGDDLLDYVPESEHLADKYFNEAAMNEEVVELWNLKLEQAYYHPDWKTQIKIADEVIADSYLHLGTNFGLPDDFNVWLEIDARPAMRAMYLKAEVYFAQGQFDPSKKMCEELLEFSSNDNMGCRYLYIIICCQLRDWQTVETLLQEYGEYPIVMLFSKAFMSFIRLGDTKESRAVATEAIQGNKYVVKYLTGQLKLPKSLPDAITLGGKDEAASYASLAKKVWQQGNGALFWLKKLA